jgi:tripartite tricarboxylate transporter family receptor
MIKLTSWWPLLVSAPCHSLRMRRAIQSDQLRWLSHSQRGARAMSSSRIVTERMGRTLGQRMVIENVGGAGGTLGSARVAAAQPDGYTLLAGSMGSHVAAPVLTPNVKYDSARDFEPIGLTANAPAVIVARRISQQRI